MLTPDGIGVKQKYKCLIFYVAKKQAEIAKPLQEEIENLEGEIAAMGERIE